jgi:putative SOS response-associated peptidase YedK
MGRTALDAASTERPYGPDQMECYPLSKIVNSPANESAECIKPLGVADSDAIARSGCVPDVLS